MFGYCSCFLPDIHLDRHAVLGIPVRDILVGDPVDGVPKQKNIRGCSKDVREFVTNSWQQSNKPVHDGIPVVRTVRCPAVHTVVDHHRLVPVLVLDHKPVRMLDLLDHKPDTGIKKFFRSGPGY